MRTKYATVKDVEGIKYEMRPKGLVQPYQLEPMSASESTRFVSKADIKNNVNESGTAQIFSIFKDGQTYKYAVYVNLYKTGLEIGCRRFGKSATKKILEWAGYKAKRGK